jgi:hypothetical protein
MPIVTKQLNPGELPATVAAPVNTFSYPGPKTSAFIEEMRGLTGKVAQAVEGFNQNAELEEEAKARMIALKTDPAELRKEIASGNYFGLAHKRSQVALSVLDAQNRAFEIGSDLDGMASRGELTGPDANARIAALVAEKSQGLSDPLAVRKFTEGVRPLMQKAGLAVQHNNIQADEENKSAQLFGYMTRLHDQVGRDASDGGLTGADLEQAHKRAIFLTADYAKNALMMQPQAIEAVMGKVAQHYANQGNVSALNALGAFDRGGAPLRDKLGPQWDAWTKHAQARNDEERKKAVNSSVDALDAESLRGEGNPADFYKRVDEALARDPENFHQGRAQRLKNQFDHTVATKAIAAGKALDAQQEQAVKRDFVEQGAQALMTGSGYTLPDKVRFTGSDGKERVYKQADFQEEMYKRASDMIDAQAKQEGWDTERTNVAKLHLYGQNGDVHPRLQASFNDLFNSSAAGVTPNAQTLPQRLAQLEFVRANDPTQFVNLADKHSTTPGRSNKQELWLHTYKAAREYGSDPEGAFHIANQRVFNPSAMERMPPKEMADTTDAVMKAAGLSGPLGHQRAAEAVQLQLAAGVKVSDLQKKAAEQVQSAFILQAGGVPASNFIPGVGDKAIAGEYLSDAAKFFKQQNGNLSKQPFDIAFADDPSKPGSYIAVRTDTMERISREGVSGAALKDFVLQWRDYYHKHRAEFPGMRDIPESVVFEK